MAISFVGQGQSGTNTVTLPSGIQYGDIIVIAGYRNTTTAPALPTNYTSINSQSANTNASRTAYKFADGTESSTNLTISNSNVARVLVFRGVDRIGATQQGTAAANTSHTIPSLSLQITNGTSWVVSMFGSKQTTSTSTPGTSTLRGTVQNGTTSSAILVDSNGGVSSWASAGVTIGASAAAAYSVFELREAVPVSLPYSENFEGGSLPATFDTQASSATSSAVIDATSKVTGTYSVKMGATASGNGQFLTRRLQANYDEIYVQFKVFIPTAFAYLTATSFVVLHLVDANNATVLEIKIDDYGTQEIILQGGTLAYTDTTLALSKNVVHTVELYYKANATTGAWKVWVDNGVFASPSASASSLNTGIAQVRTAMFSSYFFDGSITNNLYVDDFTVSTTFIGSGVPPTSTQGMMMMF